MQRLFKRGRIWYGWVYEQGRRITRTTKCRDRNAAEIVAKQWERDAADPDYAAARTATLTDALKLLLDLDEEEVGAGRRSRGTVDFHQAKSGHLVRVFETDGAEQYAPFPLSRLRPHHVDGYISRRRSEGVADTTVAKELIVLRKSLRLAVRAGLWRGRVEEVIPVAFSPGYRPRKRALTDRELSALLAELTPDRAACVAFIVATSACWGEVERARREDVGEGLEAVHIRGTKRETRARDVPLVLPFQRSLLAYATEHAGGTAGLLFARWGNVRRGLLEACSRAGIAPCSPNDLRRTFANWMVEAGVPLYIVAQLMGHKDTRMLERVYGRQRTDQLAVAVARAVPGLRAAEAAPGPDCSNSVAAALDSAGFPGLDGLVAPPASGATVVPLTPRNTKARQNLRSGGPLMSDEMSVPGPGIEPGTRGFSVPCSTS